MKYNLRMGIAPAAPAKKKKEHNFERDKLFPPESKVVLIVDGSNLFVRNVSMPNLAVLTNPAGQKSGGIYGVLKSLMSETRMWRPSTVYFVMDKSGSRRKKELMPEYKGNRGKGFQRQLLKNGMTLSLEDEQHLAMQERQEYESRQRQIDVIQNLLPNLGIRFVSISGIEADDIIGAIASVHQHVVISSTDTDFIQLHDGVGCVVYNPATGRIRTVEDFGVTGRAYAVLKSVIGDPTDNVKGLDRVGWKTMIKWCDGSYPSTLDELKMSAKIKPDKIGQRILDEWEKVEKNFQIISLHPDTTDIYPQLLMQIKSWTQNKPKFSLNEVLAILKPEAIGMNVVQELMTVFTNIR